VSNLPKERAPPGGAGSVAVFLGGFLYFFPAFSVVLAHAQPPIAICAEGSPSQQKIAAACVIF